MTTTFGFYNSELEVNIKFKVLPVSSAEDFVAKYSELPKNEYILNVLSMCVANIDSEVRPAFDKLDRVQGDTTLMAIYNGCVMLNPILDIGGWEQMLTTHNPFHHDMRSRPAEFPLPLPDDLEWMDPFAEDAPPMKGKQPLKKAKPFQVTKAKINNMQRYMKARLVGQDEPIDLVFKSLRRYQVGLNDPDRPIGVFIFAGPSGVGKTLLAEVLQEYLFGNEIPLVRIDCGEYQHKHENQKLLGSPPGYTGHEEGGQLLKQMSNTQGATVVLLDEIEKAHHDFWDTFLRVFDKGFCTDSKGNLIDFRNCIFILTSNLGNDKISETEYGKQTGFMANSIGGDFDSQTAPRREMVVRVTMDHVRKHFRPEFLNRVDETIVFNHLSSEDFRSIADLQFKKIAQKLSVRHLNLEWTPEASDLLVQQSSRAMMGARSMAKTRRSNVEDGLAALLLETSFAKGKTFTVDATNGEFTFK